MYVCLDGGDGLLFFHMQFILYVGVQPCMAFVGDYLGLFVRISL